MKKVFAIAMLCAATAFGQVNQTATGNKSANVSQVNGNVTVNPSGSASPGAAHELVVKSTPAEDELIVKAKQQDEIAKAFNDYLQQARTGLDQKNKPIIEQMKARAAKWQAKIDSDNKDLQKQLDENRAAAEDGFSKETAVLRAKAVSPDTLKTLEELVKIEQGLPDTATFDMVRRVWTDPGKK